MVQKNICNKNLYDKNIFHKLLTTNSKKQVQNSLGTTVTFYIIMIIYTRLVLNTCNLLIYN